MIKRILKVFLGSILFAFIFLVVASLAAPTFIRQDQVLAFLQKNVELPEGKKLKIDSKIKFGIFPYSYVEVARAEIVSADGATETLENILLGFTFNDIISKGIDFDFNVKSKGVDYKGNIAIKDFKKFRSERKSPVVLTLQSPVALNAKGLLTFVGDTKKFSDFVVTHKNSMVQGNIEATTPSTKINSVKGDVVINTANIDEVRRLFDLENANDPFTPATGKGKINAKFETSGQTEVDYKKNLKAQGNFQITNGEIYGFDLNEFVNDPFVYVYKKDPSKKTVVDNASGNFSALDGNLGLSGINANNNIAKIVANGSINLLVETIELMSEINALVGGQNISIPVAVTGDVKKPKITPNVGEGIARNLPAIINNPKVHDYIADPKNKETVDKIDKALEGVGGINGIMNMFNPDEKK